LRNGWSRRMPRWRCGSLRHANAAPTGTHRPITLKVLHPVSPNLRTLKVLTLNLQALCKF
jgi:hypothetical protein